MEEEELGAPNTAAMEIVEEEFSDVKEGVERRVFDKSHLALHLALSLVFLNRSKHHSFLPSAVGLPPLFIKSKEKSSSSSSLLKKKAKNRSPFITGAVHPSGMEEIPSLIQGSSSLRRRIRAKSVSDPSESHAIKADSSSLNGNDFDFEDGSLTYPRRSHVRTNLKDLDESSEETIDRFIGFSSEDPNELWVDDIGEFSDESNVSSLSSVNRSPHLLHHQRRPYLSFIEEEIESQKGSINKNECQSNNHLRSDYVTLSNTDTESKKDHIDDNEYQRNEHLPRRHHMSFRNEEFEFKKQDHIEMNDIQRNVHTPRRHYTMSHSNEDSGSRKGFGEDEYTAKNLLPEDESELEVEGKEMVESEGYKDGPTYRISQDDMSNSLLLWPVGLAVRTIGFQIRLIIQVFLLIASIFNWCNSFASKRVQETIEAKERAKKALNQKVSMIVRVPPKVAENGSILLKKAGWGCLAATYVCILLSMLLFPALVLDYVFLNRVVEEPISVREPLHFDYTLDNPAAYVSLGTSQRPQISSNGKPVVLHPQYFRAIPTSHKVLITVILTLPESDYNRNLGMFQLTAELLSESGECIKSLSRPCMLRFHSEPIRWLKTLLLGLPSLVGIGSESQTHTIKLTEFGHQHIPISAVKILLQSKAGMPLGHGIPEIYFADVHIESKLPWLKNLVRSWKWTFYIWMGLMLYIIEVIMVLCCCRRALVPKSWVGGRPMTASECETEEGQAGVSSSEAGELRFLPNRQFRSRHVMLDDEMPIASVKPNDLAASRKLKKKGQQQDR